ncbi:MAG: mechanosensitive ion channel [Cyanobacteria bacterium CRU_2_1]|nr:mechanosensitive ion channel [Cyanobacteria bacterium RU_5_0]NJR62150.1 mechanosensitive ion channel [Cyanobacteria bacterium CRU_2_1]
MTEKQLSALWPRLTQLLKPIGIICILSVLVWVTPAIAQGTVKAPIVIDGTELFEVESSGKFEADNRARGINFQLQAAIELDEPPTVQVNADNPNLPIISLNNDHLLTITSEDAIPGRTQLNQANIWASQIENAIVRAQYERSLPYLRGSVMQAIVLFSLAFILHWTLGRFWRRTLGPELRAVTHIPDPDAPSANTQPATSVDLFLGLLLMAVRVGIWLGAALYISNLFPWTRQWSYRVIEILSNSFISPIFTLGNNQYSIINLLILVVLLFGLQIVTRTITNLVKTRILRVTVVNRGAREAIAFVIRYTLLFIGALVLLQIWGIDLSSLAILASALGIGIGLGLQDLAKDIGSGLMLMFERPIQVGDFVQVGGFEGTIERIGARSTLVRTLDHISIIVPNSRFLSAEIINWSHDNPVSRLHLPVGVAYGSNMDVVRSALLAAATEHPKVLASPRPQVIFKGFGESSLNLELLVWIAEPSKQLILKSELYFSLEAQFRKHQIEIPFPQQDVHVRTGNLPIELSPQLEQTLQQLLQLSQNGKGKG